MIEPHAMIWRLRIGNRLTGITLERDSQWPGMWRIRKPDGGLTDMVNLTRAKDAAITWARPKGLGSKEVATWLASPDSRLGGAEAAPVS